MPITTDSAALSAIKNPHKAREAWLRAVLDGFIRGHFAECGYKVPKNLLVSVGWPPNRRIRRDGTTKVAGLCCPEQWNGGKAFIIYLTPQEASSDEYLSTLVHEVVHATVGLEAGHGAAFKECGETVGLQGKPTMMGLPKTSAVAKAMRKWVRATKLGKFPHHAERYNGPRQGTRMVKVSCKNLDCEARGFTGRRTGYTMRTTATWLENFGAPCCPACDEEMSY